MICFCGLLNITVNIVDFVDKLDSNNSAEKAKYNALYNVMEKQFNQIVDARRKEEEEIQKMMNKKK